MKFPNTLARAVLRSNCVGRYVMASNLAKQLVCANSWEHQRARKYFSAVLARCNTRMFMHFKPVPLRELTQLRMLLQKVRIHKLMLAGALDTLVLARDQATLAEVLGARYEVVYSGYGTFYAKPKDCAYMVSNFWDAHKRLA